MNFFGYFVSNKYGQKQLQNIVSYAQKLMGIGTGGNIFHSGEEVIASWFLNNFDSPYIIFDVGANKGDFIELMISNLQKNKDDFILHAFEPCNYAFGLINVFAFESFL